MRSKLSVLIVEDEEIKRSVLVDELQAEGYEVVGARHPLEAAPILKEKSFDVLITDIRMPGQDGISFMREVKARYPDTSAVVMTAYGAVDTAVEAMRHGAFDYLQKPFPTEELLLKLDRIAALRQNGQAPKPAARAEFGVTRMIGRSSGIRGVLSKIHAIAKTDTTVLITGESGTGKEVAARSIHEASHRASGPFVAVSCAALPRDIVEAELFGHEAGAFTGAANKRLGRFELAQGGTLFLDDVDDIPLDLQVKLLRTLQDQTFERVGGEETLRVNVRLIAATKKALASLVAAGQFREDLYYRLNVVPLDLPPLRERRDDIPLLADHFLKRLSVRLNRGRLSLSPEALAKLQAYHWPGNVRELEHALERMAALCPRDEMDVEDLPEMIEGHAADGVVSLSLDAQSHVHLADVMAQTEAELIRWALRKSDGNLAKAAQALGVPRSTLQYKVSKLKETV